MSTAEINEAILNFIENEHALASNELANGLRDEFQNIALFTAVDYIRDLVIANMPHSSIIDRVREEYIEQSYCLYLADMLLAVLKVSCDWRYDAAMKRELVLDYLRG